MNSKILILSLVFAAISYLLGSINTGILVSKIFFKDDVRNHGSNNAGATNVLRTYGKKAAALTVVGDALKGVVAIFIAVIALDFLAIEDSFKHIIIYISAFCAVIGHNFPIYFRFKGGKGVLTSVAVIITLDPIIGLTTLVIAIAIMAISKYVSLGSVLGAIAAFLLSVILRRNDIYFVVLCLLLALLVIVRHKANIKRLINGTEAKLGEKKKG